MIWFYSLTKNRVGIHFCDLTTRLQCIYHQSDMSTLRRLIPLWSVLLLLEEWWWRRFLQTTAMLSEGKCWRRWWRRTEQLDLSRSMYETSLYPSHRDTQLYLQYCIVTFHIHTHICHRLAFSTHVNITACTAAHWVDGQIDTICLWCCCAQPEVSAEG